jgi:hypothetical protein
MRGGDKDTSGELSPLRRVPELARSKWTMVSAVAGVIVGFGLWLTFRAVNVGAQNPPPA